MEWPRPEPGLVSSRRRPRDDGLGQLLRRQARAVVIDADLAASWPRAVAASASSGVAASSDLGARPFGGVVQQVAQHLLQVLALALEAGAGRAVDAKVICRSR